MSLAVRRLGAILIAALYAVSTWSVPLASPVLAQTTEMFLDEFRSVGFGGNDGSSSFAGPWRERGEADGPTAGSIQVVADDRCSGGSGNCLRVGSDGGDLAPYAVDRSADLDGAESATMRFSWRRRSQGQVSGAVRVLISGNGGSSWTTLMTIPLAGSQQTTSETFDITPWAGTATTLRFDGEGSGVSGSLHLDNVEVEASIVPSATTTTTTTIGSGTTTTTTPGSTTTTTIGSGTTTTTTPGSGPQPFLAPLPRRRDRRAPARRRQQKAPTAPRRPPVRLGPIRQTGIRAWHHHQATDPQDHRLAATPRLRRVPPPSIRHRRRDPAKVALPMNRSQSTPDQWTPRRQQRR